VNRKDFQTLALVRLREAETLLANTLPNGAYYLSGYAVECALKACIARQTQRHDFPPDPRTVQSIYTHDLTRLIALAGLDSVLTAQRRVDRHFSTNWELVDDWSEQSRNDRHSMDDAQRMLEAVANRRNGVLRWIRRYW